MQAILSGTDFELDPVLVELMKSYESMEAAEHANVALAQGSLPMHDLVPVVHMRFQDDSTDFALQSILSLWLSSSMFCTLFSTPLVIYLSALNVMSDSMLAALCDLVMQKAELRSSFYNTARIMHAVATASRREGRSSSGKTIGIEVCDIKSHFMFTFSIIICHLILTGAVRLDLGEGRR